MRNWNQVPLIMLTTLLVITACKTGSVSEQDPAVLSGSRPMTAKQAYPIAKAYATRWQAEAYLETVVIRIPNEGVETGPEKIWFSFIADHRFGPIKWWDSLTFTIDAWTGEIIKEEEYLRQRHSQRGGRFDIESAILDSSDALKKAEALGGKAYRDTYPNANISIVGESGPNEGSWRIGYFRPPDALRAELNFGINVVTGEVRGSAYSKDP